MATAPDTHAPPAAADIPSVAEDARFLDPWELGGAPAIAVDGEPPAGSVLAVCHWPGVGAPEWLAADTAAEMAARYLDLRPAGAPVGVVTNNHVDEDGMLAAWTLLVRPAPTAPERALARDAASAGDFGTWSDPWGPRVAIALMGLAEPARSPLAAVRGAFSAGGVREPVGALHRAVLPRVRRLLADPERFAGLYADRWERIGADLALIDAGDVGITEHADLDLAVVATPRPLDEMALHPRVRSGRVLLWPAEGPPVLWHRYETWVAFRSTPMAPRTPLVAAAAELTAAEPLGIRWNAEEVTLPRARMRPVAADGTWTRSTLTPDRVVEALARVAGSTAGSTGNLGPVRITHDDGPVRPGR